MQRLESESQYAFEVLPKMIKNNPEKVRFTMLDQIIENMGSYGSYRIQLIKNWFKIIIENIVDDKIKAIAAWLNNMSVAKFYNALKLTSTEKNKYKRFKISEDNEWINNLKDVKFSESIMNGSLEEGKEIKNKLEKIK